MTTVNVNTKSAFNVLQFAAQKNIKGVLVKNKRSGKEVREYDINGKKIKVEAWHSEHTV